MLQMVFVFYISSTGGG